MTTSIEQSICEAIDIIVNKAISEATYDKTVQATIIRCMDKTIGEYLVRYQDSTFVAYAADTDVTYSANTSVYVLVPGNDMSEDKTILGATSKLGINYVATVEGDQAYEINGNNIITSSNSFQLCSYAGTQAIVLYSKDYSDSQNLITIDKTAMQEYISNSGSIICGGYMRTELPTEQQYKGNYGIIFALDFMDNTGNEVVTRYYTVDVDKMTGNPYRLIYSTRQYGIFDIDKDNFIEINYISLFCYNFPNSLPEEECVDDIFITNIELYGADRLSNDDISNYSLTFVTSKGTYFTSSSLDSDTLTIEAQVRIKGQVVDSDTQGLPFYWGTEHAGIGSSSQYYCKYLGQGWKCINNYNIIAPVDDSDEPVVEWVPSGSVLTVKKSDVLAKEVVYKCAVICDNTVITKTITIKNLGSGYDITITSDSGTQFYFDIGYPTLTCLVNDVSNRNYTYAWSVTDNSGTYSSIAETPDENETYESLVSEYDALVTALNNGSALVSASQARLEELEDLIASYEKIMRVDKNIIYHVNVNTITSFSTYKCTVYNGDLYLGTASIVLTNSLTTEGTYSLLINDGTYLYKYNESGVSPASSAVDSPIEIKALTFTIFDNLGNAIDDEVARHCDIEWTVPTSDTMIQIPSSYSPTATTSTTATYSNIMSLSYNIASRYDITKTNNDISLYVNYKGTALYAKTNLTFVKEGQNGTNGTDYTCRIVPNVRTGDAVPQYLIISQVGSSSNYTYNYTPYNDGVYLKVEVYHNETRIFNSAVSGTSDEGKQVDVSWKVLKNKYTSSVYDSTSLDIDSSSGKITYSGYNTSVPANIIQATITTEGVTDYATFPVITVRNTTNYEAELKEGTGFLYAVYTSDGLNPSYDNVNPFEITVKRYINNYWEDISTNTNSSYVLDYNWDYLGRTYEVTSYNSSGTAVWSWVNGSNLLYRYWSGDLERNQWPVKPANEYTNECVTNAMECVISHNGTEVSRIHIPVHLMLNRYGLAALNTWDGNSIEINEDGGFILAPQVGAGLKEDDNTFTGVLMGATKESGMTSTDVGLIGYSHGQRSIFLDAYTGKSEFGTAGKGQIIIDPGSSTDEGTAQIYSGNYSTSKGTGLMIDLTIPEIRFGSGNFVVDSEGHITAKGGGDIAGFHIDNDSLWTNSTNKDSSSTFRISSQDGWFTRTIGAISRDNLVIASNSNFGVDSSGNLYAATGEIGSGSNIIHLGRSSNSTSYSAIYSGSKSYFDASATGFYIGTNGISLGYYNEDNSVSAFQVTSSGQLTARSGYIGNGSSGWEIGSNYIRNGSKSSYSDTSTSGVYIGTYGIGLGSGFYVSSSGSLYSESGTIGGWTITSSELYSGNIHITPSGSIRATGSAGSWYINNDGSASFTSGSIGGWTISDYSLSSGGITLSSDGSISSSGWSIYGDGTATFSNVKVTGGEIDLNGFIVNAGTFDIPETATISGTDIKQYVVNTISSGMTLTNGTSVSWNTVRCLTGDVVSLNVSATDRTVVTGVHGSISESGSLSLGTDTATCTQLSSITIRIYYQEVYALTSNGSQLYAPALWPSYG